MVCAGSKTCRSGLFAEETKKDRETKKQEGKKEERMCENDDWSWGIQVLVSMLVVGRCGLREQCEFDFRIGGAHL